MMSRQIIQEWTSSEVHLNHGALRDVKYTIFKEGDKVFQQIADVDGTPVHTLELPEGLALEKSSYEVMLRYVLADIVNA
jgi:hypothetical protein